MIYILLGILFVIENISEELSLVISFLYNLFIKLQYNHQNNTKNIYIK